jgi:hypothetical protein
MISYRDGLAKIGIPRSAAVSYRGFASRPKSLRQAISSMDAPTRSSWSQVAEIYRDDFWTDEVQGVAWDGANWIFSTNANQEKPGSRHKALYVFKGGQPLGDDLWISTLRYIDVPHPVAGAHEDDDHWGQITYFNGFVYVAHFWNSGPFQPGPRGKGSRNVVRFRDTGGTLSFDKWIQLDQARASDGSNRTDLVELQGINPWDGMFYTCFGSGAINELFIHDPETGDWTGRSLALNPAIEAVQGACFSPNGHIYLSTNGKVDAPGLQPIWCHSALNGHQFAVIPVLAQGTGQELEGICFANLTVAGGAQAQIHAILLDNPDLALDNIFFKSFGSTSPSIV